MPSARLLLAASAIAFGLPACGGEGTTTPPVDTSPKARLSITAPPRLSQGETGTVAITINTGDTSSYRGRFQLEITGAFAASVTVPVKNFLPGSGSGDTRVTVPRATEDGPLLVVATALDRANVRPDTAKLQVLDTTLPSYGWYLTSIMTPRGDASLSADALFLAAGDDDRINLAFADNHEIAWLGYRIGAPINIADSTPSRGSRFFFPGDAVPTDTASLALRINHAWQGTSPHVIVFARDKTGNLAEVDYGPVPIGKWRGSTARVLAMSDSATDVAIDSKRQVMYLSMPDAGKIAVVDLAGPTLQRTIDAPAPPLGLDLTVSGDSLVVALYNEAALGIVDLSRAAPVMDTVPLGIDKTRKGVPGDPRPYLTVWPERLRVASNGRVVIGTTWPPNTSPSESRIVVYDPATKATETFARAAMWHEDVGRSADRSLVVVGEGQNDVGYYDPVQGAVRFATGGGDAPVSLTANGDLVLFWGILRNRSMTTLRQLGDTRFLSRVSVLKPDGSTAIMGTRSLSPDYYVYRVSDGLNIERGGLPFSAQHFAVTPDGSTLIVLGGRGVALVDLR